MYISALNFGGTPEEVLALGRAGPVHLFTSPPTKEDLAEFIGMIVERTTLTEGRMSIRKIKDDFSDEMLLACAIEGKADLIVSRDSHLRNLKRFQGVRIVDVRTFMERVKRGQ